MCVCARAHALHSALLEMEALTQLATAFSAQSLWRNAQEYDVNDHSFILFISPEVMKCLWS